MFTLISRSRIAIGSLFFIHGVCFSSWGARIPSIQAELGLSEAQLGTILFSVPLGSIASMPLANHLTKKRGSKQVVCMATIFYALTLLAVGAADTSIQLSIALIAFGLFSNLVNVSINTQAVGIESILGKTIMSSLHGLWSLAGFGGAAFGALMIAWNVSPFHHFLFSTSLALIILAFNFTYLIVDQQQLTATIAKWKLPSGSLLLLGAIAFCSMICEGAMFDWSGVYFKKVIMVPEHYVGLGYSSFMFTMAITRFIADRATNHFGLKRILQISGLLMSTGLLIALIWPTLTMGIIGFLLVGAGTSAVVPLVFSEAGKIKDRGTSYSIAVVSTIGFLGFLIGPPIIGHIAELSSLRISFLAVALMGILTIILSRKIVQK